MESFYKSQFKEECTYCKLRISAHTKHCFTCNRCCDRFDHHCMWLNNCIGANNYAYFISSLINLFGWVISQMTICALFLIKKERAYWAIIGIDIPILLFDLRLLSLHFYLWRKGITTFTYIKFKMQKDIRLARLKDGLITR